MNKILRKIKYAVLDDVEQIVVLIEDGSIATAHNNDEFVVINWYSNTIPNNFTDDNIDEMVWQYLDSGRRYWKDLHYKQVIDDEVIMKMLWAVYGEYEFEKDEDFECCCEGDIKTFLNNSRIY